MTKVPATQRRPSADELRPYIGQWVLVVAGKVIGSALTLTQAFERLDSAGLLSRIDSIFYVPERPEERP